MQMTRSFVAVVSGLSGRRPVKLHVLFDHAGTALDESLSPLSPGIVRQDIGALLE
jgi:hypothetical protein